MVSVKEISTHNSCLLSSFCVQEYFVSEFCCTVLSDVVECAICYSPRMTKFDIRNYFWKIYGVRVAKVNTRIQLGKLDYQQNACSAIA